MVLPEAGPEGNHKGCPYGDSAVVGMTDMDESRRLRWSE